LAGADATGGMSASSAHRPSWAFILLEAKGLIREN
jgi:hypothetical protein